MTPDLIETMRVWRGALPLWPWHRARLRASAAALGIPVDEAEVARLLHETLRDAARETMLRLVVSTGHLAAEVRTLPASSRPFRLGISPVVVPRTARWLSHKTSDRAAYTEAADWAARQGMHDALLRNADGEITEASIANVIVALDGVRWTPPTRSGLLPGVMRQVLLDAGVVREREIDEADLRRAESVWLCNAVRGVWRVECT